MDHRLDDELQKALASWDLFTVKKYLNLSTKQSCDDRFLVNQMIENRWNLWSVVQLGRADLTKLFLDLRGSIVVDDPKYGDAEGILHKAVKKLDVDHVKLFLDFNADPNLLHDELETPLAHLYSGKIPEIALKNDDTSKILKMLYDRGANLAAIDDKNKLQAKSALRRGSAEEAKLVLSAIADLRTRYKGGVTVAHYLAQNRRAWSVWESMREREFDVNARSGARDTPLRTAAECGNLEAVQFLLSLDGVDVNAATSGNHSPIYAATDNYFISEERYRECIVLLLIHGADIPVEVFDFYQVRRNYSLAQLFLGRLALQEALGTPVTEVIEDKIDSESKLKECFDDCKIKLNAQVYGSLTLFTLLTCDEEKLVPYMRNKELVAILHSYLESIISTFGRLLHDRMKKASEIGKLRESAAAVIGKFMGVNRG